MASRPLGADRNSRGHRSECRGGWHDVERLDDRGGRRGCHQVGGASRLVLLDEQRDDAAARLVVQGLETHLRSIEARIRELAEQITAERRKNATLTRQNAELRDELEGLKLAKSALESTIAGIRSASDDRDSIKRNLDILKHRADQAGRQLDDLLAGKDLDTVDLPLDRSTAKTMTISLATMTRSESKRAGKGFTSRLSCCFPRNVCAPRMVRHRAREPWQPADFGAVALAGLVGGITTFFDTEIDANVREGLRADSATPTSSKAGKGSTDCPINYTGPNFGGPDHRVRSSGHDIGRPFAALRQIRDGQFRGWTWEHGVRSVFETAQGSYTPVDSATEAIAVWMKHLAPDFLTSMSLPLPDWTALSGLPIREVRKFAHRQLPWRASRPRPQST